jgi:hypothetical protein
MTAAPNEVTATGAAALSSRTAIVMFGAVAATCLGLVALAETPWVKDKIRDVAWSQATSKKQIPMASFYREFLDSGDQLIHEELPAADFSRGGVYFDGASNMAWAMKLWDLPPEIRPWIHNLAVGGWNHADQFGMIRYLVEKRGLLEAGGPKTLFVFGVSYHSIHNARLPGDDSPTVSSTAWRRHGLFTAERDGSVQQIARPRVYEEFVLTRTRMTGVLKELVNLAYTPLKSVRVQNPKVLAQEWVRALGDRWKQKLDLELAAFDRMVGYLRERGVNVIVVQLPQQSWDHETEYESAYMGGLRKVCEARGIPIRDFSRLIPDNHFADSVHLTTEGMEEIRPKLIEIGLEHLRSIGALAPERLAAKH